MVSINTLNYENVRRGSKPCKMYKVDLEMRLTGRHSLLIHYSYYMSIKASLLRP